MGGRTIPRAVTRVKFEQASKKSMQTPTRLLLGEGRAGREEIDRRTCLVDPPARGPPPIGGPPHRRPARAVADQAMAASAGRGAGWRREAAHERRQRDQPWHAARRGHQPVARRHLHEPVPEALALTRRGEAFNAHVISYADDFVILSRGHAQEALTWTKVVMAKLGLTINEAKTSLKDARRESFDFLGYTLGPHPAQGWPLVSRGKPVQEECAAGQHEDWRTAGAGQQGHLRRERSRSSPWALR